MAKTGIARGGDEILRPQSFYGSSPARPAALRTIDADGKSNVGVNKALNMLKTPSMAAKTKKKKAKLPDKPKPAAMLFAEMQVDNQVLDRSSSFPMLDAKQLRKETQKVVLADSLKDWHDGKVSEDIVEHFIKKEEEDQVRYKNEIELWNKNHPEDELVLDSNGIAIKKAKLQEVKEAAAKKTDAKLRKKATKALKEKRSAPVATAEMLAISKRAAARIAKNKKKASKLQYESLSEGSGGAAESEDSEPDADASSAVLSTDEDENEKDISRGGNEEQKENEAPRKTSKGKRNKEKRLSRRGSELEDMPGHDQNTAAQAVALKGEKLSKQLPTDSITKPKAKKQRERKASVPAEEDSAAEDALLPNNAAVVDSRKAKGKTKKAAAQIGSKKSMQKKGSKRSRQETVEAEKDQRDDPAPHSEPVVPAVHKKAKRSTQALGPVIRHADQDIAEPEPKRKRSKRRSQGAAIERRQQPRRLSAGSDASKGEYCGAYALDV